MDIAELNLSVRDFNAVKRFGINSTEELIERLPDFCKEHRRTGAKVTETLHKLGLLPFHLGEWVEPERCAEELAPEEFREGAFIIMGFPTESRDDRKVVLIIKIDGDQLYFIDGKSDLMHHMIGDSKVWHIKLESEEAGMSEEMKPTVIVSEDYTRAVTLTRSIIANAQAAQQSLYEVCKGLKEMRDGKLYKELGYSKFEDYTENEVGIKRRQAHNYIMIAENMSAENVQSIAQIGSTKLTMLAMLDEPTREAVTETVDVESVTVKELKAQITALTAERDENEHAAELLSNELDSAKESLVAKEKQFQAAMESKKRELDSVLEAKERIDKSYRKKHAEWIKSTEEVTHLTERIFSLETELKELESRPVEVAVSEAEAKEIESLTQELEAAKKELAIAKKETYEEAQRIADKVRHDMQNVHEAEMQTLREGYEKQIAETRTESNEEAIDEARFNSFRLVFEELVDELENLLETMYDDPRIAFINRLDNYWTDNLLYLKREGAGAVK